jgi:4-amino-4-deoxy-L-arabinose transferase-like glycosyltransferase
MAHVPGHLYYSLYDAKQPFLMWLFGISSSIFSDPLFAGRFVSFLLGLLSAIGLYYLGKELFSKRVGFIASFTYILIPIFVLFDRQALLESAITTSGIWSLYFVIKSIQSKRVIKFELLTGLSLGLGYFSKTTAFLFFISTVVIFLLSYFKSKNVTYLQRLFLITCTFVFSILILLINPQFWQTISTNSRYVLTPTELFNFPMALWISNLFAVVSISFVFITPIVLIISLIQIIKFMLSKKQTNLILWISTPLLITLLTMKAPSQRYTVSLLPLVVLLFATFFKDFHKNKTIKISILMVSIVIPLVLTLIQIYKPLDYFTYSNKISNFSEYGFVNGQVSGYGLKDVVHYLDAENKKVPIVVTYAENSGNPESALSVILSKKDIMNGYFEFKYLQGIPNDIGCIELQSGQDLYFVSRDEQLTGFDNFVEKVKTITKPLGQDTLGIYIFKKGCSNPLRVSPVFKN